MKRRRLDARHPVGASHHQKLLVVDDAVAFCGGADFTRNRWDTRAHLSNDPRRRRLEGGIYPPRHEVMAAVDGAVAACLVELARDRWQRAGGAPLLPVLADEDPWPANLAPDAVAATVGISRTMAAYGVHPAVREVEALYLRAIAQARRWIYIENRRSLGLDTECDLCIEAEAGDERTAGAVRRLLARLLSEHLGCEAAEIEDGIRRTGRLVATFDAIVPAAHRSLQAVGLEPLTLADRLIARRHLYDPAGVTDNWRPWRRRT